MKDYKLLFGKRLAKIRKDLGWSQEKLALESGMARSYLSGVESGRRNISLLNIFKLADVLSVHSAYVIDIDDEFSSFVIGREFCNRRDYVE